MEEPPRVESSRNGYVDVVLSKEQRTISSNVPLAQKSHRKQVLSPSSYKSKLEESISAEFYPLVHKEIVEPTKERDLRRVQATYTDEEQKYFQDIIVDENNRRRLENSRRWIYDRDPEFNKRLTGVESAAAESEKVERSQELMLFSKEIQSIGPSSWQSTDLIDPKNSLTYSNGSSSLNIKQDYRINKGEIVPENTRFSNDNNPIVNPALIRIRQRQDEQYQLVDKSIKKPRKQRERFSSPAAKRLLDRAKYN